MPASSTPATCTTPAAPKRGLELQQLAQALPLRAVFGAPPRDGVQNCLCARARISPQRGFRLGIERAGLDDVTATDLSKQRRVTPTI